MYDRLITGGHLLTMQGNGVGFIENGAVAIEGRRIVAVGPREEIEAAGEAREVIDATDRLVMPGLIDAHLHSAMVIGRGWAQEVDQWMDAGAGPMLRQANPDDQQTATMIALMEGVANGTTTFGDYYGDMSRMVHSHVRMGSRGVLCQSITERSFANRDEWIKQGWQPGDPTPLDPEVGERTLREGLAFYDVWNGQDSGRIKAILGPHAADFLSKERLLQIQEEARKRETLMHLHVAQDVRENNATLQRYGLRAVPFLDSIGLLGPDLIAVHISVTTPEEVETVARSGSPMTCCSNSIGIIDGVVPPAWQFKQLGGLVALGSDQAPGNNSHNMFSEMRATAMYAKIKAESPLPMPAWEVLRSATIDGATVLGIDHVTGSLEVGKEADIIMLDTSMPPLAPILLKPARNVVPNLVYAETGRNVVMTMVAGEIVYQNGKFARIDVDQVQRDLVAAAAGLQERAAADPITADTPITQLTREGRH